MSTIGQRETQTQQSVIDFFRDILGYSYLGNWKDRPDNRNVENKLLTHWLARQSHSDQVIAKVLFQLDKATALSGSKTLYDANREFHVQLRYGVKVQPNPGEQTATVWLIDLRNPAFAIA